VSVRDSDGAQSVARTARFQFAPAPLRVESILFANQTTNGSSFVEQFQSIETTFSDREGAGSLKDCVLLISPHFQVRYDVQSNEVFVCNGEVWSAGFQAGRKGILSNGYGSLDASQTHIEMAGTRIKISWRLSASSFSLGTNHLKARAEDASSASPWAGDARWNVSKKPATFGSSGVS